MADEKTADEMARPPRDFDESELPPDEGQEYPVYPIVRADDLRRKVVVLHEGGVFEGEFRGKMRRRCVFVWTCDKAIDFVDKDGQEQSIPPGERAKTFSGSRGVVRAVEHYATSESFPVRVKVIPDPDTKGMGIKFVAP